MSLNRKPRISEKNKCNFLTDSCVLVYSIVLTEVHKTLLQIELRVQTRTIGRIWFFESSLFYDSLRKPKNTPSLSSLKRILKYFQRRRICFPLQKTELFYYNQTIHSTYVTDCIHGLSINGVLRPW